MRTTYNGAVEGTYASLPFGDGESTSGSDYDANHYAQFDPYTDHAQFRQYANTLGRFMSPDPYGGSHDASNPQSFNRYVYALNNPLSNVDPSGKVHCDWGSNDGGGEEFEDDDEFWLVLENMLKSLAHSCGRCSNAIGNS